MADAGNAENGGNHDMTEESWRDWIRSRDENFTPPPKKLKKAGDDNRAACIVCYLAITVCTPPEKSSIPTKSQYVSNVELRCREHCSVTRSVQQVRSSTKTRASLRFSARGLSRH